MPRRAERAPSFARNQGAYFTLEPETAPPRSGPALARGGKENCGERRPTVAVVLPAVESCDDECCLAGAVAHGIERRDKFRSGCAQLQRRLRRDDGQSRADFCHGNASNACEADAGSKRQHANPGLRLAPQRRRARPRKPSRPPAISICRTTQRLQRKRRPTRTVPPDLRHWSKPSRPPRVAPRKLRAPRRMPPPRPRPPSRQRKQRRRIHRQTRRPRLRWLRHKPLSRIRLHRWRLSSQMAVATKMEAIRWTQPALRRQLRRHPPPRNRRTRPRPGPGPQPPQLRRMTVRWRRPTKLQRQTYPRHCERPAL